MLPVMSGQVGFVLASASPRRRDLLAQIGRVAAVVIEPDIDESVVPGELPAQHAARLAREKCDGSEDRIVSVLFRALKLSRTSYWPSGNVLRTRLVEQKLHSTRTALGLITAS